MPTLWTSHGNGWEDLALLLSCVRPQLGPGCLQRPLHEDTMDRTYYIQVVDPSIVPNEFRDDGGFLRIPCGASSHSLQALYSSVRLGFWCEHCKRPPNIPGVKLWTHPGCRGCGENPTGWYCFECDTHVEAKELELVGVKIRWKD